MKDERKDISISGGLRIVMIEKLSLIEINSLAWPKSWNLTDTNRK